MKWFFAGLLLIHGLIHLMGSPRRFNTPSFLNSPSRSPVPWSDRSTPRLFIIDASMRGVPVEAFHRFLGPSATMRVKVASIFPMVDAKGPDMNKAETVTLFNGMCVFAPGALVDPGIQWREIDPLNVSAAFTNAGITIQALLTFNAEGELVDFVPTTASPDPRTASRLRPCGGRPR